MVYWLGENVWLMMTGFFLGVADVGGLRSVTNLVLPASHIMVAAGRLIQPHASRVSGEQGPGATATVIHTVAVLLATGAFVYFALVTALHVPLMRLLYGGKFMEYAYLAPWMTLGLVFQAATQAYNVGLRALRFPSSLLIVYAVSTGVGVIGGLPATYAFGLHGMIVAAVISNFALGLTAMLLFRAKAGAAGAGSHCYRIRWLSIRFHESCQSEITRIDSCAGPRGSEMRWLTNRMSRNALWSLSEFVRWSAVLVCAAPSVGFCPG